MRIGISMHGLDKVRDQMARLSGQQVRAAMANAINDTAYQARREVQAEMDRVFDRVTPWVRKSPKVFEATPDQLEAYIAPTLHTDRSAFVRGGKEGVDPQDVLQAQALGEERAHKRSEKILLRAGILPAGWQTAIPDESRGGPFPGSVDAYGNIKGTFIRSVLSYLQTYTKGQGYQQNMSKAAMERMHTFGRGTLSKRAQAQAGPFMGRRYFIAGGRDAVTWDNKKYRGDTAATRHLQPGIYAVMGKERKLRAVLIFTKPGRYKVRFDLDAIQRRLDLTAYMARRLRYRIRNLAEGKPA